jgi:hypothetical protein
MLLYTQNSCNYFDLVCTFLLFIFLLNLVCTFLLYARDLFYLFFIFAESGLYVSFIFFAHIVNYAPA